MGQLEGKVAIVTGGASGIGAAPAVLCAVRARGHRRAHSRQDRRLKAEGDVDGGVPPLGYRAQDGKLLVIESEAEIVCDIFRRYAELGSVRLLNGELDARGIKSKSWTSASGRCVGGKSFSHGALYHVLQNHLYRGEIVHKRQSHPGEHTPIIDQPLWDAVQAQLNANTTERGSGTRTHQPSLLAGMLFDGGGNRMTPTHATKKGTRYRYYVSRSLITNDQTDGSAGLRIPAGEIEQAVTSRSLSPDLGRHGPIQVPFKSHILLKNLVIGTILHCFGRHRKARYSVALTLPRGRKRWRDKLSRIDSSNRGGQPPSVSDKNTATQLSRVSHYA